MKNSHRDARWSRMVNFNYGAHSTILRPATRASPPSLQPRLSSDTTAVTPCITAVATATPSSSPLCSSNGSTLDATVARLTAAEQRARHGVCVTETLHRQALRVQVTSVQAMLDATASPMPNSPPPPPGVDAGAKYEPWVVDDANTRALLAAHKYAKAYLAISARLPLYVADSHDALWQQAILHGRRGLCSLHLMNYAECVEDCQTSLRHARAAAMTSAATVRVSGEQPRCATQASSYGETFGELEVHRHLLLALIMREDYAAAKALLHTLLTPGGIMSIGPQQLSGAQCALLTAQQRALPAVEQLRTCVTREAWAEARRWLNEAAPLLHDTPLCTLHALVLLECGEPAAARVALTTHVAALVPPPPPAEAAVSAEEQRLYAQVSLHYVQASVLLAKASVYCGRAFMDVAAVLLRRCLQVQPWYGPAITLGNYLVTLEDLFAQAERLLTHGQHDALLGLVDDALQLDPANTRVQLHFRLLRAEACLALHKPFVAIDECSRCIAMDASSARAFYLRARAQQAVQRATEAAADCARAIELQPSYAALWHEAERKAATEAAERARRARAQAPRPARPSAASEATQRAKSHAASRRGVQTLYDVLGLPRGASHEAIRASFKQLTLRYHPDKLVGASAEVQRAALETFKRINDAHSVLADPQRRAAYDATLPTRQ